jgi:hypothetical protein
VAGRRLSLAGGRQQDHRQDHRGDAGLAQRPLGAIYAAVFIDAIVARIRDGQVANRPVCAAVGVTLDGGKDILGLGAGTGGLNPVTPQDEAGIRIDPPMSEPVAGVAEPAARAAADPPPEPPGECAVCHGLRLTPQLRPGDRHAGELRGGGPGVHDAARVQDPLRERGGVAGDLVAPGQGAEGVARPGDRARNSRSASVAGR